MSINTYLSNNYNINFYDKLKNNEVIKYIINFKDKKNIFFKKNHNYRNINFTIYK